MKRAVKFFCSGIISGLLALLLCSAISFSSYSGMVNEAATCTTGVFTPANSGKQIIPYTYLRQADVAWEKRVWRFIDLREKINEPFLYPLYPAQCRVSLIDVVKTGLNKGRINAFVDDEFKLPITAAEALSKFVRERTVEETDSLGNITGSKTITDTLSNLLITRINIKEDWFFDKQKSVLEVRIVSIGFEYFDEDKGFYRPLFWLYFPQCRQLFSEYNFFNPRNDNEQRSYEEVFMKRMFNSVIQKESNLFDRGIDTYSKGLDALIEADRIKSQIFTWEHDLWHF